MTAERSQDEGRITDEEIQRKIPPSARGREIQVGIFVLVGIVSFIAALFLLTDPAMFRGRYKVSTEVPDAGGIRRGDPVQMRGVNIGRVDGFEMAGAGVRITIEVAGEWPIPSDSRARLAAPGILGGRTVEVIPGSSPQLLMPGGVMPGESVSGVMDIADDLGEQARVTLDRIQGLLDDEAIASVHASLRDLGALMSSMATIVRDQRDEVAAISASLRRSAGQIEELTGNPELERGLARADSTLAELRVAGESLTHATESFETVIGRVERGEGTLGKLATDEDLYQNLNTALEEILLLERDIRENPGRYIRLRIF
ncbi:MAG: MCE family protein [Gemmatimonadetes bacterium]|nr:MCE family protein [Gemmatimonadota bacterium]